MSNVKSAIPKPDPATLLKTMASIGQVLLPLAKQHRTATIYDGLKSEHPHPIRDPKDIGVLIQNSRKSKKLTQQQLADLAGVGRRFIVECEAGKPRLEFAKVLQVAAAAGIDILAVKR
jgi:y4mF family transcriptional regulator